MPRKKHPLVMKRVDPVKKAHLQDSFTAEQISELQRCSTDFMYFACNYVYVQHPVKGRVLFEPYPYQVEMLQSLIDYGQLVFMAGRQLGKTTIAAIYIIWRAMFRDDQTILIAGNKNDTAIEVMSRVKFIYENLPAWIKPGVTVYNVKNVVFENGSEIITRATTKDTGRGLSISLLYCDEFAMVDPPEKQRDFWASIRPTLSTGGDCIITSTPLSDEDTFSQIWYAASDTFDEYGFENARGVGKNGFKAIKFIWSDHPDRDEKWADQEKAAIGIDRFKREHECEFISDSDTLIDPMKLAVLKGRNHEYNTGQTRWYHKPIPNATYLVALDPSMGTGGDFSAIQVFQLPEMIQVAEWQHNRTDLQGQVKTLLDILRYIDTTLRSNYNQYGDPEIYWTIENNSVGEGANVVIQHTGEEKFPGTYLSEPKKSRPNASKVRKGYHTSNKTKLEACARFKSLVERDKMILYSKPLVTQLKVFVSKGASYGAKSREHDDLVSACLLIVRMLERVIHYNEDFAKDLSENVDEDSTDGPLPFIIHT